MSEAAQADANKPDLSSLPASAVPNAEYAERALNASQTPSPAPAAAPASAAPQRPEGIPEKFWDAEKGVVKVEDMAKSYGELEQKFSQRAPEKKEGDEAEGEKPPVDKPTIDRKPEDEKPEGDKPAPLATAIEGLQAAYSKGEVTDEAIQPLLDAGLPRNVVDTYLAGIKALERVSLLGAHDAAGGKDAFESAVDWARRDLSDADLAYYNEQVANPQTAKQAVEWLVSKHRAAVPSEGRFVKTEPPSAVVTDTFASQAQMLAEMQKPEYQKDLGFRQQVAEKLQRSIRAGTISATTQRFTR